MSTEETTLTGPTSQKGQRTTRLFLCQEPSLYMKGMKDEFAELDRGQIMKGFVYYIRMFEYQESMEDSEQEFHHCRLEAYS